MSKRSKKRNAGQELKESAQAPQVQPQEPKKRLFVESFLLPVFVALVTTLITTLVINHAEETAKKETVLRLFEYDIESQQGIIAGYLGAFRKIKEGQDSKFPASNTLGDSLLKSHWNVSLSLTPHHSYLFEVFKNDLYVLPQTLVPTVITYYRNLDDCEIKRKECQEAIELRSSGNAASCGAYEDILTHCQEYGKTALQRVKTYRSSGHI